MVPGIVFPRQWPRNSLKYNQLRYGCHRAARRGRLTLKRGPIVSTSGRFGTACFEARRLRRLQSVVRHVVATWSDGRAGADLPVRPLARMVELVKRFYTRLLGSTCLPDLYSFC